ncbi:MAG: YggT family protein [Candidatus Delongbacteria bacterium]|nr:YggT family protein [Candidatus Delongbacteria bacterium]MBN2834039.1 YggT family protein [Candidatus Delongbacteria bacterium]
MNFIIKALDTVYTVFLFLMVARMFLSFSGNHYSSFYKFVYKYTEFILSPIRRKLPVTGMIDFSPLVALILLGVARGILAAFTIAVGSGEPSYFFYYIYYEFLNLLSSLILFLIILYFVKVLFKSWNKTYTPFYDTLNRITNFFSYRIEKYIPLKFRDRIDLITLAIFFLLLMIINGIRG